MKISPLALLNNGIIVSWKGLGREQLERKVFVDRNVARVP